ncbi:UvrD-helicase domain-containing protein [Amycolatopsis sp. YIM 10]|uniref:UvrD-helicase domain-containing protein n=1 Tax=Amycolatopsis sp. YIM 10 TaxID=2653857 RepID=UPI00128FE26D|nr:UvrD-helicase domain-containing protein [Amycolatopsis sp. YIM 10]QFU91503.1 Putative ATP-dependent DNA helicase YjcD [Amycolatopsis sp. YIM 10]
MNLSKHATRLVAQESSERLTQALPGLSPLRRRVFEALLVRTAQSWSLLLRRTLPADDDTRADAFLFGPTGIYAIVVADHPPGESATRAIRRHAEERLAGIRDHRHQLVAGTAVHLVLVSTGRSGARSHRNARPYWELGETQLDELFRRDSAHLTRRQIDTITEQAARRLPDYAGLAVRPPERAPEPAGLLLAEDLTADQVAAAQTGTFDSWLTFLHPHQLEIVTRRYNGPARISGPAGTGKTVVVLHRLRHLARRSTGPLLFTTFVKTLPPVIEASFRRLAPEVADRVEFVNLHAWLSRFLSSRGHRLNVDSAQIRTAFARAWGPRREALEQVLPGQEYAWTEVDRVIKGRGITSFDEYAGISRRGRGLRLAARHKELIWQLYLAYQEKLTERGIHDYNDMVSVATAELAERPLAEPYAAVAVDEVQDITLAGLRFLRLLAGDGPDRLLLVGDGQQQVYPGGWRLSDAGIPIQGRGEVLRINYRNRGEVLAFAQRFDANDQVDDLDGASGVALLDVESVNSGGTSLTWRGPRADVGTALRAQLDRLSVPLGRSAVVVFHRRDLPLCTKPLREAGIAMTQLDDYRGEADDRLKVGTVHRAKGLDFQAVLVVEVADGTAGDEQEAGELRDRQRLVAATRARDFLWWAVVTESATESFTEPVTEAAAEESVECVHEMPIEWCATCKKPPRGTLPHGYRTRGGSAYHNDPQCNWLRKGQDRSHRQGKNVHDKVPAAWASVNPGELEPCEFCCTPQWLKRHGH